MDKLERSVRKKKPVSLAGAVRGKSKCRSSGFRGKISLFRVINSCQRCEEDLSFAVQQISRETVIIRSIRRSVDDTWIGKSKTDQHLTSTRTVSERKRVPRRHANAKTAYRLKAGFYRSSSRRTIVSLCAIRRLRASGSARENGRSRNRHCDPLGFHSFERNRIIRFR